jgi:hypothetical protein
VRSHSLSRCAFRIEPENEIKLFACVRTVPTYLAPDECEQSGCEVEVFGCICGAAGYEWGRASLHRSWKKRVSGEVVSEELVSKRLGGCFLYSLEERLGGVER